MTDVPSTRDVATLGGPVSPGPDTSGHLYVGPSEDPDRFELVDGGTRGGEGRTWRASYRGRLNAPLANQAVKMLFPPTGAGTVWPTPADIQRWHDHAALLRHLDQQHVVRLLDIFAGEPPHAAGTARGGRASTAYLLMEWVEGPTLADAVRGHPVTRSTLATRLQHIAEIASAVSALHSHTRSSGNPTLHRDLTPANCIVNDDRGIVLIDISGMRLVDDGFDPLGRHTPAYTAPEVLQAPHEQRQRSSDLYALGAVAIFCLTGEDPPAGDKARAGLADHLSQLFRAARARFPAEAAEHLLKLLSPEPDERPADAVAWASRLAQLATPRRRRRTALVGAAAVIVGALAVSGGLLLDRGRTADAGNRLRGAAVSSPSAAPTGLIAPVPASRGLSKFEFASTAGRIDSPTSGFATRNCEYLTGRATVRPGYSLVTTQHNLSETLDDTRYVQVVYGYNKPKSGTWNWRTAHYFNPAALDQRILLELIEVPLKPLIAADRGGDWETVSRLADEGQVLAALVVTHVNAVHPTKTCENGQAS